VTYESVLKRERAALHKVAAHWLEQQASEAGRLDEFAGLLGEHCLRAGDLSEAADWYLRAGRVAFGQGAPREATRFYGEALQLLPPVDQERRWQALLLREEALGVLGEDKEWKADVTALVELARFFGDDTHLAEAYLRQSLFGFRAGEMSLSELASAESLKAARRCGNEAIEAKALIGTAVMDLRRGDKAACAQKIKESLQLARRLADESVLASVLVQAAFCQAEAGQYADQFPLLEEQIALDHRLGNRDQEARGLVNMGAGYIGLGQYKKARSFIEGSQRISEALGAYRGLAYALLNLGDSYQETGDLRRARELKEEALTVISRTEDIRGKSAILVELALVMREMGDASGAARRFSEARDLAASQGLPGLVNEAEIGLAACAVMHGQLEEARQHIQGAWEYLKENGAVSMSGQGRVYKSCAETFDALGQPEDVQAVLERAHQDLMDAADSINVPEFRQSFLENVPDNRAIMEMWERRKS
jgi:tetratricopeptide (TPR) repeat protein